MNQYISYVYTVINVICMLPIKLSCVVFQITDGQLFIMDVIVYPFRD